MSSSSGPIRRLTNVAVYTYDGGNSQSMTLLHSFAELDLLVDPTKLGQYGLSPADYVQVNFGPYLGQLIGTLFYLIFTCTFAEQEGSPIEYFMYPKGLQGIEWNGGVESHSFVITTNSVAGGITGECTAGCVYSNVVGMIQPFTLPAP